MRLRPYLPLALMLAAACNSVTTVTPLTQNAFPPRADDCNLQTITMVPPGQKYVEIALISSTQMAQGPIWLKDADLNAMLPGLKAKACRLGADAILIKSYDPKVGEHPARAVIVAIKYTN